MKGFTQLAEDARTLALTVWVVIATATTATAEEAKFVMDCDTTSFRHADGSVNTTGPSRGAVFAGPDGKRAYGLDGRPCSVPEEVYQKMKEEGDSDEGGFVAPWPDEEF
jgi:hypothetical protein